MIHPLECRETSNAPTPTRLLHGNQVEHLFHAGMQQRHTTHHTRLVCNEDGEVCQEVIVAVAGVRVGR